MKDGEEDEKEKCNFEGKINESLPLYQLFH